MGSFSDYAENKLLDHIVGKLSFTMPVNAYVALCTVDPTDASTGATIVEVTDANSYARKQTIASDWNSSAAGSISNSADFSFPTSSGSWGIINSFALLDSATHGAGNVLAWGTLTVDKTVVSGDTVKFTGGTPGDLVITLD